MKFSQTRRFLALSVLLGLSSAALAQAWPASPIKLVVTFPPGGSSDAAARIVAPKLAERLGQPVVVDNKPGAGGGLGLGQVAKAAPDGYTLVLASAGGLTANPSLYKNLAYDPQRDFAPITGFGTSPFVLAASATLPVKTVKDVIDLAKKDPGKLTYASGGNGTAMHLSGELLNAMASVSITHVPYKGSGPAVVAIMGGETSLAIADITTIKPQMQSGRLKVLGVLGKTRSSLAPELPTLAESGLPGYESNGWFAILAPAGTPPAIVKRLNAEFGAVLRSADVRERFSAAGLEPMPSTPEELAALMKSETVKWAKVIKDSGAKID
ncbi:Bug family tripartite tricarboxylate transporter substrate binding protein [Hylemonella sp. W303a]|uniref:Bug family tripartite tricarboxylate transporter substrate binding protein n=1 Tax=Hylemonella sp. W303a TaxID=3389873 RepID=UPI00396B3B5E